MGSHTVPGAEWNYDGVSKQRRVYTKRSTRINLVETYKYTKNKPQAQSTHLDPQNTFQEMF